MPVRRRSQGAAAAAKKAASRPSARSWDATDQKRSDEALRLSEARLRAVLESAVDAIITINECGRIQSVNAATMRLFGYTAAEMLGENVKLLMPAPYQEEHDGYMQRYLLTGEKRIIGIGREVQARKKDGTVFPIDLAVSEVEPGKLFTGIVRDISDRKLSEARLRESDRMASIGTLAAGLGHDMNNVLLPVRAHLNALKIAAEDRPAEREHLEKIHQGVSYLQQLADGLHFLAMNPDEHDDTAGMTDVHAWWEQTGSLLSKAVPKHVKVMAQFAAELPKIAVPPHALTQAMLNLIVNAGEAIPAPPERKRRQGYVRLSARVEDDGSFVRLNVSDNGTGMSEEVKRRAFDMFFTTKPRGLGTGLGLAMVRKVVDRAGGSIEMESEVNNGTTMSLIFPVVDHLPAGGNALTAVVLLNDGRAAGLVQSLLEASGARVTASDGQTADIVVLQPTPENLRMAKKWRQSRAGGVVVVMGRPEPEQEERWQGLEVIMVDDASDFEAVRAALGLAIAEFS